MTSTRNPLDGPFMSAKTLTDSSGEPGYAIAPQPVMDARTYKIYYASGDPLRTYSAGDDPLRRDSREVFTAAEAADIVSRHPYAWFRDGDIIVNTYRTRCGDVVAPVTGRQMAARLRKAGR